VDDLAAPAGRGPAVGIDAIEVERNLNLLGEGLSIDTFRVHVEAKITDHGKVKACVGPFKGVMNPIPHCLFALNPDGTRTEIDVILPGTTVRKKKALDAPPLHAGRQGGDDRDRSRLRPGNPAGGDPGGAAADLGGQQDTQREGSSSGS